ncbi:tumor necrosis factor ligand superfamily member 14 [Tachysurus ichikawai]
MADGRVVHPSIFVVDSGIGFPPPLLPKPGEKRIQKRRKHLIQKTLSVLVCLALLGLLVEAFFIYSLHHTNQTTESNPVSPKTEALKGSQNEDQPVSRKSRPFTIMNPTKPLAHLTVAKKPEKEGIMEWSDNETGDSIRFQLKYRDGKLIIQKEGFYYVYSKLSYSADGPSFIYTVERNTSRYLGKPINLLRSSSYNSKPVQRINVRDSSLGGVFHLLKDDALFVHVNNGSLIRLHISADNYFGTFML